MNSNDIQQLWQQDASCPEHEVLEAYARGELKGEAAHAVERHLVNCDMCRDITEGLAMLKDPDGALSEIGNRLAEGLASQPPAQPKRNWLRYAAAILAIAVTSVTTIYLLGNIGGDANNLAVTTPEKETTFRSNPPEPMREKANIETDSNQLNEDQETFAVTNNNGTDTRSLKETEVVEEKATKPEEAFGAFKVTADLNDQEVIKKNASGNAMAAPQDVKTAPAAAPMKHEEEDDVKYNYTPLLGGLDEIFETTDSVPVEKLDKAVYGDQSQEGRTKERKAKAPAIEPDDAPIADKSARMEGYMNRADTFNKGEAYPQFPGGEEALQNYLRDHLDAAENGKYRANTSAFHAWLTLDGTGHVKNVELKDTPEEGARQRIEKVLKDMPAWIVEAGQDSTGVEVIFPKPPR
ncbi:MAG: hypothetical protein H6585_11875 [Flavobacteriales bacterium]|nr:hypothetical protein [Flavobacteriales bacterium]MCB9449028.1 hypothetical protein [Flavobacteriales bacterium]